MHLNKILYAHIYLHKKNTLISPLLFNNFSPTLQLLKKGINLYKDEDRLWVIKISISNGRGKLCLHLIDNLNYFIDTTLDTTFYLRHRDDEFSLKNVLRLDLLTNTDNCIIIVKNTILTITEADLEKKFP